MLQKTSETFDKSVFMQKLTGSIIRQKYFDPVCFSNILMACPSIDFSDTFLSIIQCTNENSLIDSFKFGSCCTNM
jgi:hypothetical protein